MAYKTTLGREIKFPYSIASKLLVDCSDDVRNLICDFSEAFEEIKRLDYEITNLRMTNQRLQHENDFMVKLINDRD